MRDIFYGIVCLNFTLACLLTSARPETVESLFIAYRLTGDPIYRENGWQIFQAIEKHCKVESGGYVAVLNVDELPVKHEDKMETFLLVSIVKICLVKSSHVMIGHRARH